MKHIFNIGFIISSTFLMLLFLSCHKEEEKSIPSIEIYSPSENSGFAIPDSISVVGQVSDRRNIITIRVQLVDENYIPVLPAYSFHPDSKLANIDLDYPLVEPLLKSGKYFMHIRAENKDQFRNDYTPIFITGLTQEFNQVLVITASSDSLLQISGFTLNGEDYPLFTISGDYANASVDNQQQLLYIAGKENLNLTAVNINSGVEIWRKPDIVYKPMHNDKCLYLYEGTLYVSFNYQHIYAYDNTGKITFDAPIDEMDAPGAVIRNEESVVVDIQKKNASQPLIRIYSSITGNEKQEYLTWARVQSFFPFSKDSIIVCANSENGGSVYYYDVQGNNTSEIVNFGSTIQCTTSISSTILMIGLENGLYTLNLSTGNLVNVQQNESYSIVRYEEFSGKLFLVSENQISIYTYPEMEYQKTVTFSDTILDVLLNYSF